MNSVAGFMVGGKALGSVIVYSARRIYGSLTVYSVVGFMVGGRPEGQLLCTVQEGFMGQLLLTV